MKRRHPSSHRGGFTLIELLVVIGIILLLISILMPVVSRVRLAAYDASTQQQMQRIMQACESYFHDWNSYPGPVANVNLAGGSSQVAASSLVPPIQGVLLGNNGTGAVTSSENLVLGLLGFLNPSTSTSGITFVQASTNPPHDVYSLNPNVHATYHYIDYVPNELTTDFEYDLTNEQGLPSKDTNIPEFIDRFPKPLPILYLRAFVGGTGTPAVFNADTSNGLFVQYNWAELSPYGCNIATSNGLGTSTMLTTDQSYFTNLNSSFSSSTLDDSVQTPYMDYNGTTPNTSVTPNQYDGWLTNPNIGGGANQPTTGGVPRGKDGFMLIAAGKDRVYGTHDDTIITP